MTKLDIKAALLNGYGVANAKPKEWPTYDGNLLNRAEYVTASEVGKCARMVLFDKLTPPAPFKRWGFAERGHAVEAWAADLIRLGLPAGNSLMLTGDKQVSFYYGNQSGTPDGVIRRRDGMYEVLELKSIDPRTNTSYLPKQEHVKQCYQNIDLVEACWKVTVIGAHLVYVNASDFQAIYQTYIEADHDIQAGLEERANTIMLAETPNDLPAEGMFVKDGCKYCKHTEKCSAMVAQRKEETATMKGLTNVTDTVFRRGT